jgi:hypothetical protein
MHNTQNESILYNNSVRPVICFETIPISKRKFTERGQIDSPSIHTHDSSISWLGTGTPMNKNVGFKLFFTSEKHITGRTELL